MSDARIEDTDYTTGNPRFPKEQSDFIRILDEIQAALLLRGSCKQSHHQLASMPLGNFLDICLRNSVRVGVRPEFPEPFVNE